MSEDLESINEAEQSLFRPFTRESLAAIEGRKANEHAKQKKPKKKRTKGKVRYEDEDENAGPRPDATLEQGLPLPVRMQRSFPLELTTTPLEDIDPFYHNQRTFVVISKGKYLLRFSATNALWILNPFNPIRRIAIYILVHPLFSWFILTTVLLNCIFMIMPITPTVESTEIIFVGIYTFEGSVKIMARGFILHPFSYLRDPWNWLDFVIIISAYLTIGLDIGNLAAIRSFRVLRLLKAVAIVPGLKTIFGVVIESVKNLRDVITLTMFSLSVFAVMGLQMYMGVLTQKCIKVFPEDGSWGNLTNENWERFCQNATNWFMDEGEYRLCGNSTGAGQCEPGYVCLQGYGPNPNYGYTNFDTFGWAFLSAFRLMTLDYWENLYHLVLQSAGPWHVLFFVIIIFLGFFCLVNLMAIVAISYNKFQKNTAEDEQAEKKDALQDMNTDETGKVLKPTNDNPFIESSQQPNVVDMKDVMVMDEIIEQAGKQTSEQNAEEDEDEPTFKKRVLDCTLKGIDFCCVWDCCWLWLKFQKYVALLVFDPFTELFITLCVVLNTLFMAIDHHDMDRDMERMLKSGNYFFIAVYGIEAMLKIIAMSPKFYFKERWNIFDFIIVVLSLLELSLEGVQGLSVLRLFRLLRVFKLAKSWPALNLITSVTNRTMGALRNLTFVLCIIIFTFAMMGMELFGKNYIDNVDRFPDGVLPRWNFTDFLHSYMIVFRVLCGEWIESMWDCMLVGDVSCILFFLATVIIGNLVVMYLFLALLLTNFGSSSSSTPSSTDKETTKIAEAFNRISRFGKWTKRNVTDFLKIPNNKLTNPIAIHATEAEDGKFDGGFGKQDIIVAAVDDTAADCCPKSCYQCFPFLAGDDKSQFWQEWGMLRLKTFKLTENTYFKMAVITVILLSSLALALEDVYLSNRPILQNIIYYMDIIVAVIFFIEMLVMWIALGFHKYFTNAMCRLDFIIVMVSLIDFVAALCGIQAFKLLRTLRALRPLRIISRIQNIKVVVNTLVQTIPSIFKVLLVCFIYWLVFAIMGVQLFAGKFFKCVDVNHTTIYHEITPDRYACILSNYTWENSVMNFDHVGKAYLCLFQVATFKGWIQIMNDAIDSREVGRQPIRETNIYMYLYFVFFIIFGSFFTLNLLIGVIINHFNMQKKKAGSSLVMFMTNDQKKYYNAKKMGYKKPLKAIPKPKWRPQASVFKIVTDKKFDLIIMLFIGLNVFTLMFDHYKQSETLNAVLDYINMIFIVIFTLECLLKIIALRCHYFLELWNLFDFVIVTSSILSLVLSDIIEKYFISPTLLRVVRIAKFTKVLPVLKSAKGIRRLLSTLAMTLPALFNMCLLLFLVMFIFAIFGMTFFMHVKDKGGLDDVYNFKTFGQSMILLLQMSTLAGWDGVLDGITNEEECELPDSGRGSPGNCGSAAIGITYLLSYLVISCFIIINMYIAVVLEIYSQAMDDVQVLTDEDYDMYYKIWQRFDPDGTQYIRYDQLSDFLDVLEPPLQIHKPNKYKIISLDIPICRGDMMFCADILDALRKDLFARKGNPIEDPNNIEVWRPYKAGYEPVSSTLLRQHEDNCACLIQHAWRKCRRGLDDSSTKPKDGGTAATAVLFDAVTPNGHRMVLQGDGATSRSPPTALV